MAFRVFYEAIDNDKHYSRHCDQILLKDRLEVLMRVAHRDEVCYYDSLNFFCLFVCSKNYTVGCLDTEWRINIDRGA